MKKTRARDSLRRVGAVSHRNRPSALSTIAVAAALLLACSCEVRRRSGPASEPGVAQPGAQSGGPTAGGGVPGTLHEHVAFQWGGQSREYHFYRAGSADNSPRPLVLVLHGGGAVIDAFIGKTGGAAPLAGAWLDIAAREGVHLLIPQGLASGKGPHWNDCRGDCTACGEHDDAGFLLALVDAVAKQHPVDTRRVYASGESNGAIMALRLAQEHPDRFAAVGGVIGLMPKANDCRHAQRPASVAIVAGTADRAARYDGRNGAASGTLLSADDSVAYWLKRNRCNPQPTTRTLPDADPGDSSTVTRYDYACPATGTEVRLYRVDGGGHAVPSTSQRVTRAWEMVVGKQNHDIETAGEHWDLFRGKSL